MRVEKRVIETEERRSTESKVGPKTDTALLTVTWTLDHTQADR